MRFTKIKYNGLQVQLSWIEKRGSGGEIESTLKSWEQPHPDLANAMRAFVPIVFKLLDVSSEWETDFLVVGLSINEEELDGRKGLVVTCTKKLDAANAPLVLNTPHLREPVDDEDFERAGFFIDGMDEALSAAVAAAKGYLEGKRQQGNLFDKQADEQKEAPAEDAKAEAPVADERQLSLVQ